MLELTPELKNESDKPLYTQLYEYIKELILSEKLKAGDKLPSIRALSTHLDISKNTVVTAYDQLLAEGYVSSSNRSGVYVEKLQNDILKRTSKHSNVQQGTKINSDSDRYKYDLRKAQIDLDSFPFGLWRKALNGCLIEENSEILNYGEHQGDEELREQIARYLFLARGVKCRSEQILLGAGTQQSLTMLTLILRDVGRDIAFEEPGYNGARHVFTDTNYNIVPINLESDGIDIELLTNCPAKIVYITPSHQFPCGMVMPVAKRLMLLQWAQTKDGYIIEDDYDGEFRYHGKPIPALQGLDANGRVVYLGTFSKSLIPSIRISYMVLPDRLLQIYKAKVSIYEQPVPRLIQRALQLFMEQGHWDRHIKKMRNIYKKKHDLLLESINNIFGNDVEIIGKDAGLHVLLKVNNGMSEKELIQRAAESQVGVSPTAGYWYDKSSIKFPLVFLGFGGIKTEDIPESIKRLKRCWFSR